MNGKTEGNSAGEPACIRVVRDIPYAKPNSAAHERQRLDLYLPEESRLGAASGERAGFPTLLSIHGGALQEGDKSGESFIGECFARAGIATAVINYRLSPGVMHPAHVEDAALAFAWVKRHIAEYAADPSAVFLVGHSAGAYLAALLSTDARYLAKHELLPRDIRGVIPVSAFYWVERVAPERPKTVWGHDRATWLDASPVRHLKSELPPLLIAYADGDDPWRRQQNLEMAEALREAGNTDVRVVEIAERDHATVWQRIASPGDALAVRIIEFVRGVVARGGA